MQTENQLANCKSKVQTDTKKEGRTDRQPTRQTTLLWSGALLLWSGALLKGSGCEKRYRNG